MALVERCSSVVAAAIASTPGRRNTRRNAHTAAMAHVSNEAAELRRTLLVVRYHCTPSCSHVFCTTCSHPCLFTQQTFTGERLRRTLDWSLSSVGDDVTSFTKRLTEMEMNLFRCGAAAAAAHAQWKTFGTRRILVSASALRSASLRTVTPEERPNKRVKVGA